MLARMMMMIMLTIISTEEVATHDEAVREVSARVELIVVVGNYDG